MTTEIEQRFPRTCQVIASGISRGLHSGVQVFASQNFTPVADFAVGDNAPGRPLTADTRMLWLSAGKPITATAVMKFVERGQLELQQPVVELIPEFTGPGTERITIWNLLTHTAGLKPIVTGFPDHKWEQIIAKIAAAGLKRDQTPGSEVGYDPGRTWFLLGEILQRIDGRPIAQIIREEILEPVEMLSSWLALPSDVYDAEPELVGLTYTSKDGKLNPNRSGSREYAIVPSPGSSMRGPIRELGWFYEMLLRNGETRRGEQLLKPETVREMTRRQRENLFDVSFQHTVDFGLGLIVNSNRYGAETVPYGFGRYASEDSFGHGGSQSSIGFADPERQLVVAAVANGMPGDDLHNQRFRDLNSAIYEDLGLA
ncbi:serine hydrolase domain-containing protein [Planctomicrobium piriforme]|uniref:CubicO group peptidase, beta-lactamase class C family n=1 Tax=Planctomicrobium piriforme TaxID=1576369 RepID=A0A1I3K691_9PLAN|nr:serine hydrolase domain-containing protein [Planctomicrobium piriforme]SFI68031.1 CubicO group peptidase, beta-lactamase class C family [Planctomicrobium piriforme]